MSRIRLTRVYQLKLNLQKVNEMYEKERASTSATFELSNKNQELLKLLKSAKEIEEQNKKEKDELFTRLHDLVEENLKLEEALKRSQEIIEEQVMEIDESMVSQDPNLMLSITQERAQNEAIIFKLKEKVQKLKNQLSMTKNDLQLERARKASEHSDNDGVLTNTRKLSDETARLFQKLMESSESKNHAKDRGSPRDSFEIELSKPPVDQREVKTFPSLINFSAEKYSDKKSKPLMSTKELQTEPFELPRAQPEIIYRDRLIESPEKVIIKEKEVAYIVSFSPNPAFDFRSEVIEKMNFEEKSPSLKVQSLASNTFMFSGIKLANPKADASKQGDLERSPISQIIISSDEKLEERWIVFPQDTFQMLEFTSNVISNEKSLLKPTILESGLKQTLCVPEIPLDNFPNHEQLSGSVTERQLGKASFLKLDLNNGILTETEQLPYAQDLTSINIRKILAGPKNSSRLPRQKAGPSYDDSVDLQAKKQAARAKFARSEAVGGFRVIGQPENPLNSKLVQPPFAPFNPSEAGVALTLPPALVKKEEENSSIINPYQTIMSSSILSTIRPHPDTFKEKKIKLNYFFEKKNQEREKGKVVL